MDTGTAEAGARPGCAVGRGAGTSGETYRYLPEFPEFSNALADLTAITYGAGKNRLTASGAVFLAIKP
jgi:hypothetical protein